MSREVIDMMEMLERLDSWYGRLSDITEELTEMGFDVVDANAEYIDVAFEEDGDDVHVAIRLGGTQNTITINGYEEVYRG
jgi:hypothetical protein